MVLNDPAGLRDLADTPRDALPDIVDSDDEF